MERKAFEASSAGRVIYVPGGDYWAYVPNPLPPSLTWTPNLVSDLSAADRALGELSGLGRVLPDPHLLVTPFVRREAVLSSQIGCASSCKGWPSSLMMLSGALDSSRHCANITARASNQGAPPPGCFRWRIYSLRDRLSA